MRTSSLIRHFAACVLMVVATACWGGQRDLTVAEVHVYQEQLPDKVRYTYVVTNKGAGSLTGVEVGFDYYIGEPELLGARPLRVVAPPGWTSRVTAMEESNLFSIAWESGAAAIPPGQMRTGFVVETALPNQQLLVSHWTITADGPIVSASNRLVHIEGPAPGDTLPPIIGVAATPARVWPPNGQMVAVSVDVNASDETDPNPVVKLLSVTCNECAAEDVSGATVGTDDRSFFVRAKRLGQQKTGRVYTATYQATDAAGNAATAKATITVPHDTRK